MGPFIRIKIGCCPLEHTEDRFRDESTGSLTSRRKQAFSYCPIPRYRPCYYYYYLSSNESSLVSSRGWYTDAVFIPSNKQPLLMVHTGFGEKFTQAKQGKELLVGCSHAWGNKILGYSNATNGAFYLVPSRSKRTLEC